MLQFFVAWAGEGLTDPSRLNWWSTQLLDEWGGEDLFKRLLPRTFEWALLEATRQVANTSCLSPEESKMMIILK
ncbi:BrxE family protein, partial [Waterburya agarophytonicola K14]|nr:BrxE family protein [Waterburya agarophytonicola KI4]